MRNRCRTGIGFYEAPGRATVVKDSNSARLKLSCFWPFRADSWIIGLDPAYRWAVVGILNRKYLWIVSRTPRLRQDLLDAALASAAQQGHDLAQLRSTARASISGQ